ncbi:MAG TPA: response regulator [Chlamydiales bacterium]|nr:response regulator [Chlamydiales bacterium]
MANRIKIPTLLLIAENPSVRSWVKKHLNEQFFIIDATKRGEAIEAARHSPLDFVIVDSGFEDCDPLALCRELRQILHQWPTQIFLITGRLKKSYRDAALEAGVTDFLSHQLDLEELEAKIATGKKTASVREKTADLSTVIRAPKNEPSNDQALRLLAAAKIEKIPVTLLVLRLDPYEEEILSEFTKVVKEQLKESDLLIPFSGGSFILLLPNMHLEAARNLGERLKKEIQRYRFETKKGPLYLTVSIAISPLEATENTFIDSAMKSLKQTHSLDQEIL